MDKLKTEDRSNEKNQVLKSEQEVPNSTLEVYQQALVCFPAPSCTLEAFLLHVPPS